MLPTEPLDAGHVRELLRQASPEDATGIEGALRLRPDSLTVWALLPEALSARALLWVEPEPEPPGWHPDFPSALGSGRGPILIRATLAGEITGGGCLLLDRSTDVTAALRFLAAQMLSRYRHLPVERSTLASLAPLEAYKRAHSQIFGLLLDEAWANARKNYASYGHEVIVKRADLDGQFAVHAFGNYVDELTELLSEAWEDPGWTASPVWDD